MRRIALTLFFVSLSAAAQDAEVIGPQSTVEQYDPPVVEPDLSKDFIDFPSLIRAPMADDGKQIIPMLNGIDVEFVGTDESIRTGDFVSFRTRSKAAALTPAIYDQLMEKLRIHRSQPLVIGDLRLLQTDITETYRNLGYPLMSVVVPPQEVKDGHLLVQINEFRLADFDIMFADGDGAYSPDADHWTSKGAIERAMNRVMSQPILSQAVLDREVKMLNQNPFREVRVVFEPGDALGQSAAILQVSENKPWNLTAGYNNHATEASGENRYTLGGTFANLPFEAHQLSANITLGDQRSEFENYSLSYRAPNRWGHTLSVSANYSDTASSTIPGITSASTTTQYTINYAVPILQGGDLTWSVDTSALLKQFERASLFNAVAVGGAEYDAVQVQLNSTVNLKENSATNQFTARLTFSLEGVTGDNEDINFRTFYNTATGGAETEHFVLGYARVQQLQPLGEFWEGWTTETQLSWQITEDQLAGSDNFAIGGANVFKAYQSSEVAGDEGWYVTQALNPKPWSANELGTAGRFIKQLAVSAFVETGRGSFKNGGSDNLWDYGFGLNARFAYNIGCRLSVAVAGAETNRTDDGDVQAYIGCNFQY